ARAAPRPTSRPRRRARPPPGRKRRSIRRGLPLVSRDGGSPPEMEVRHENDLHPGGGGRHRRFAGARADGAQGPSAAPAGGAVRRPVWRPQTIHRSRPQHPVRDDAPTAMAQGGLTRAYWRRRKEDDPMSRATAVLQPGVPVTIAPGGNISFEIEAG